MSIFTQFLMTFATIAASWESPIEQNLSEDQLQLSLNSSLRTQRAENFTGNERSQFGTVGVCSTEECRLTAQIYAEARNENFDKCQYSYESCDIQAAEKPIPQYLRMSHRLKILTSTIGKRLKGMLESAPKVTEVLPVRQAKKFYKSCMDIDARKAKGIGTIASILKQNGGWPMAMSVEDWKEDARSWQEVDEKFTSLTADYTFYDIRPWESLSEDSEDKYILLKTPRDFFPEFRENFEEYRSMLQPLIELFVDYYQANIPAEELKKDINDLFIFEQKLREVRKLDNINQLHVMSLGSWTLDWDYKSQARSNPKAVVHWQEVIQHLLNVEKIEVDDHWQVMVAGPYYWSLIEIWNTTDKRTIVNYIHWKFVNQAMNHITEGIRNNLLMPNGPSRRLPRWLQCLRETGMHHANAYWFVENYFGEATPEAIQKLVQSFKKELKTQIEHSNSMNNDFQSAVKEKLGKTEISLGFPDWYKNQKAIEYLYEGLTIGDDYVKNILRFRRYKKEYDVRSFVRGKSNDGWTITLLESGSTTQTSYVLSWNIINIPSVLFRPPFFGFRRPG